MADRVDISGNALNVLGSQAKQGRAIRNPLQYVRSVAGLSVAAFARETGIHHARIAYYEGVLDGKQCDSLKINELDIGFFMRELDLSQAVALDLLEGVLPMESDKKLDARYVAKQLCAWLKQKYENSKKSTGSAPMGANRAESDGNGRVSDRTRRYRADGFRSGFRARVSRVP